MPKSVAAEWFLRLFTTPDRAAAIAGDMSEEGRVAWFDLLRTAAALFFRNVAGAPFRLSLLILFGAVVSTGWGILITIPIVRLNKLSWALGTYYFVFNRILVTSLVGYLLVRLAKGRDITACLAYAVLSSALGMAMSTRALWYTHLWHMAWAVLLNASVSVFFLLASGVCARRRFLTRAELG